jgi:hypothetical protein
MEQKISIFTFRTGSLIFTKTRIQQPTIMLTPTKKKHLIVSLDEAQQQAAAGHFSDPKILNPEHPPHQPSQR